MFHYVKANFNFVVMQLLFQSVVLWLFVLKNAKIA